MRIDVKNDDIPYFSFRIRICEFFSVLRRSLRPDVENKWLYSILFEQGMELRTGRFLNSKRWWLSGMLLTGIIISNGCKNVNVYKLSSPRKRLWYGNINHLQQDGFEIHSRFTPVRLYPARHYKNVNFGNFSWIEDYNRHRVLGTFKADYGWKIYVEATLELEVRTNNDNKDDFYRLIESSSFPPSRKSTVRESLMELLTRNVSLMNISEEFTSIYQKKEEACLLETLRSCGHTAVALPELAAIRLRKNLQKTLKYKRADISSQAFSGKFLVVSFHGETPGYILGRVRAVHESGILRWWEARFAYTVSDNPSDILDVQPASMTGNIVVIFSICVGGVATGFALFLVEIIF